MTTTATQSTSATMDGSVMASFGNAQALNYVPAGIATPLTLRLANDSDMAPTMSGTGKTPATITIDFSRLGGAVTLTSASVTCPGFSVTSWTGNVLTLTMKVGSAIWHRNAVLTVALGPVTIPGPVGLAQIPVTVTNFAPQFDQTAQAPLVVLGAPQAANTGTPLVSFSPSDVLNGAMGVNPGPAQTLGVTVTIPVPPAGAPASSLPAPQVLLSTVAMPQQGMQPLLGLNKMTVTAGSVAAAVSNSGVQTMWQLALAAAAGAPSQGQPAPFSLSLAGITPEQMTGTGTVLVYTLGFSGCNDGCTILTAQIESLPVAIADFTVTPTSLTATTQPTPNGEPPPPLTATLSWTVNNAAMVTLSSSGVVPAQATAFPVTVEASTTFMLTAWGSGFQTMDCKVATVEVTPGLQSRLVPSGVIMAWNGTVADIPVGWVLCDGTNGTPDLRDRFILGAGAPGGSYPTPGQSGSGDTHTHTVSALAPNGGFSFNTSFQSGHVHGLPAGWYAMNLSCGKFPSICTGGNWGTTQPDPGHGHTVVVSFPSISTDTATAGRPPWYALCYVMKS